MLPDPKRLYEHSLHETEWAFMKNAIYFAGQHFDENAKTVRRKGNVTLTVAILFGLEILALVAWIAR